MLRAVLNASPHAVQGFTFVCLALGATLLPIAARRGWSTLYVAMLVIGVAGVVALTLTPSADGGMGRARFADMSVSWVGPSELTRISERSLNVVLFVPLAAVVAFARDRRGRWIAAALTLAAPFAIEAVQYAAPQLGRSVQLSDSLANAEGVLLGLLLGAVAGFGFRRRQPAAEQPSSPPASHSPGATVHLGWARAAAWTRLRLSGSGPGLPVRRRRGKA